MLREQKNVKPFCPSIAAPAGAEVTLAGIGDELFVTSSHGVQVKMDALAKDLDFSAFDAIVLPGGMPGTTRLGRKCACG